MGFFEPFLTALSLCADCFAVSLCSSMTIKKIKKKRIFKLALFFAVVQTGLLVAGWLLGSIFLELVQKLSGIIGGALLIYVGFSMLMEGLKNRTEGHDLNGMRNIMIAAVATSIDALAIGAAEAMNAHASSSGNIILTASCFVLTFISVSIGILGAKVIGKSLGRWAEIAGGAVLLGFGVSLIVTSF